MANDVWHINLPNILRIHASTLHKYLQNLHGKSAVSQVEKTQIEGQTQPGEVRGKKDVVTGENLVRTDKG